MALSALQGSSKVMWTRRRWFFTRLSACREIPELAASEMMATNWKKEVLDVFIGGGRIDRFCKAAVTRQGVDLIGGSDLLCAHEAVFLLDVDVVDGETLLGPGLVTHAAVGTPDHATLTPGHLQKTCRITYWKDDIGLSGERCMNPSCTIQALQMHRAVCGSASRASYLGDFIWSSELIDELVQRIER